MKTILEKVEAVSCLKCEHHNKDGNATRPCPKYDRCKADKPLGVAKFWENDKGA